MSSCRLCLEGGGIFPLFSTESTEIHAIPLSLQVTLCTGLAIDRNDNKPRSICRQCKHFISEWYCFRSKCRQVDRVFKSTQIDRACNEASNINFVQEENVNSLEMEIVNRPNTELTKPRMRHKCSLCPDSFLYIRDLQYHKVNIHGKKSATNIVQKPKATVKKQRYQWQCCGKVFVSKLSFLNHIQLVHPGEKPFSCDECGKGGFVSEETLRRHKMLHSGRYSCQICGKRFTCNAILRIHQRDKHENDRPFVCDVCGKAFVTELLLSYHQRFHTGEKKYVCEICGVAFVTSSILAKHLRTHSTVKPHVCEICGKGFIVKSRLVEHIRSHTGERPFSCDICGKGFATSDKLKRHQKTHADHKAFCCDVCGNAYSTNHGLSIHRKSHFNRQQVSAVINPCKYP